MAWKILVVATTLGCLVLAGCMDPNSQADQTTSTADDAGGSLEPTEAALAANAEFLLVPAEFTDCGETITTSGWPTTTMAFGVDPCILESSETGQPASYGIWGRDHRGGIDGVHYTVGGPDEAAAVAYHVAADGTVTIVQTQDCRALVAGSSESTYPECVEPEAAS